MKAEIFRWNDDRKKLKSYDGFIIPGGFSYEDRGRSGVIASKDPVMDVVKAEADKGKPIIGICNGAQILVEKGLIPGLEVEQLEMSLAWNRRIREGKILGVGFYNDWIHIRHDEKPGRSAFNRFPKNTIMRIPVAHGEGRFTTKEKGLLENLIANGQTLFRYCDENGEFKPEFPVNPNGALHNLAGVCNPEGNVMSLMPHPERTVNGQAIFDSMASYISGGKRGTVGKTRKHAPLTPVTDKVGKMSPRPEIEFTISLKITDNEGKTIENAVRRMGFKEASLTRQLYYGFYVPKKTGLKALAEKIIATGEICNLNKEIPTVRIGEKIYDYDKHTGLTEKNIVRKHDAGAGRHDYIALDNDDFAGKSVMGKLSHYLKDGDLNGAIKGVHWTLSVKNGDRAEKIVATHILHNPHSMKLIKD
jgi:phosphoribosylformylglycinamidine synthase